MHQQEKIHYITVRDNKYQTILRKANLINLINLINRKINPKLRV